MNAGMLTSTLIEWVRTAEKLSAVLDKQSKALISRNTADVDAVTPLLEELLSKAQTLDEKRDAIVKSLSSTLKVQSTVSAIIAALPPQEAKSLKTVAEYASRLAHRIKHLLERNTALIESELIYVRGTLGIIVQAAQQQPYGVKQAPSLCLDKAV